MSLATYVRDAPAMPPPPLSRPVVRASAAMQQVTDVVEGDASDVLAYSAVDPSIAGMGGPAESAVGPGLVMGPASPYPDLSRGPGFGGPGYPVGRAASAGPGYSGPDVSENPSWFRYGLLDASIITLGALVGVAVEKTLIPRASGGYGLVLGALTANAVADAFSTRGSTGSWKSGLAAMGGAMLPMAPLLLAIGMKRPLKGTTAWALGGVTALVLVGMTHRQLAATLAGRA